MSDHRIEAKLNQDGKLVLENLPFQAGDVVEVIVTKSDTKSNGDSRYSLEGDSYQIRSTFGASWC